MQEVKDMKKIREIDVCLNCPYDDCIDFRCDLIKAPNVIRTKSYHVKVQDWLEEISRLLCLYDPGPTTTDIIEQVKISRMQLATLREKGYFEYVSAGKGIRYTAVNWSKFNGFTC
jgi:hypothetical protein